MLGAVTLQVRRRGAGAYVDGEFVAGAEALLTIRGSAQPLSGRELELLPEGARTRARWKLYSTTALNTVALGAQSPADRVLIDGLEYEVHSTLDYAAGSSALRHYKYILVEIGEDEA